jgi:thiamine biosynthesis lipoprotein
VEVSAPLAEVIALSLEVHRASEGAFDVTVGPLVDAWGFGPAGRPARQPTEDELAALLACVGSDKLALEGKTLAKAPPKRRVDLSAVAKGDAIDRLSDLLARLGEPDHLVEIGGELRARGHSARGGAFQVGIEEPELRRQAVRKVVQLEDRALATSGNYRNFLELEGRRVVHTVDPRTGQAVQHGLLSASVLHPRCAAADAWATALMAAGPDRAWALAEANGLEVLLLLDAGDGGVVERASPGFSSALLRTAP